MRRAPIIKAIAILLLGVVAFELMSVAVRLLGEKFSILQINALRNFLQLFLR